jgi:Autotransporter beta-domain
VGARVNLVQYIRRRIGTFGALWTALPILVPYPADAQLVDLPLPADLDLPTELSNSVIPVLDGLRLPVNVAQTLGAICSSPFSSECRQLLQTLAVLAPSTQQIVTTASAAAIVQTNSQIVDFAFAGGLLPAIQSAAVLQSVSPTVMSFGISGVSHTSHNGFQIESPGAGRTLGFDSLDAGFTLGVRMDASRAVNLPPDWLTLGLFGNYTNSAVDVDSNPALRKLALKNVGDATLNAGSGGGYALLTNGAIYGLGIASGQWGEADPRDKYLGSTDFNTTDFASSIFGGVIVPVTSVTKVDFRVGLNYLDAEAENHSGFGNLRLSDGRIEQFSGSAAARLFAVWQYERMVVRPFVQGGVDYRFLYENKINIETVEFSFDEGRTTVFGRTGVDLDIGERSQVYFAFRADHNDDFDSIAGQAGLTIRLN